MCFCILKRFNFKCFIKQYKGLCQYTIIIIMTNTVTTDVPIPPSTNVTPTFSTSGRVKWFNNKAGYGFITVTSGDNTGSDVFVHHSAIEVGQEQYRYLVQGEYVMFQLCSVKDETHKWQAGSVKGINDGKLMCETRLESRESRAIRTAPNDGESAPRRSIRPPQVFRDDAPQHYRVRSRGPGPREGDEYILVRRRAPKYASPLSPSSPRNASQDVLRARQHKTSPVGGSN
jgi:cold shock CspA family protein